MSMAVSSSSFKAELSTLLATLPELRARIDPYDFYDAVIDYYSHPAVRNRIAEYCGAPSIDDPAKFTCVYLLGHGRYLGEKEHYTFPVKAVKNFGFQSLLDRALDIFRSVQDTTGMQAILDIEYFNHLSMEPLLTRPHQIFASLEPVYNAILEFYHHFEIPVIASFTPSGYHFECKIPFDSDVYSELITIGHLEDSLKTRYRKIDPNDVKRATPVPEDIGLGYSAIGRLFDYIAHWVIRRMRHRTELPITISDPQTGDPAHPNEGISLDTTQYADPITMRPIRIIFSTHQKHKVNPWRYGGPVAQEAPIFAVIPRYDLEIDEVLTVASDLDLAKEWAKRTTAYLPTKADGWLKVIEEYRKSRLYRFHQAFDAERHDDPSIWYRTYYAFDTSPFSPSIRHAVATPNPELLVPTNLQLLCRELYTDGWHPKHIAGLIRAHYERPELCWNVNWAKYDPEARANYWVRTYTGFIIDELNNVDPTVSPYFSELTGEDNG